MKPQPEARDLDGDSVPELLICRGSELQCYSAQKLQWNLRGETQAEISLPKPIRL